MENDLEQLLGEVYSQVPEIGMMLAIDTPFIPTTNITIFAWLFTLVCVLIVLLIQYIYTQAQAQAHR